MQSQYISTNRYTQNWRNALCVFYFVFLRYPYSRHCQEPRDVCLIIATSIIVVHTFLGRIVVYEEVVVDCPPLHDPGMVDIFFIVVVLGSYVAVSCWNIYKNYMYNIRINSIYIYIYTRITTHSERGASKIFHMKRTCLKDSHCTSKKNTQKKRMILSLAWRPTRGPSLLWSGWKMMARSVTISNSTTKAKHNTYGFHISIF